MSCFSIATAAVLLAAGLSAAVPQPPASLVAARVPPSIPGASPLLSALPPPFGAFDIRAFGAVGDGVAGCTAAIQAALDAAVGARGGTVFIPAGAWRVAG